MSSISLADVWGRAAYEKILEASPEPSQAFQDCLHFIWLKAYGTSLPASAWPAIKDQLLSVVDPNNPLEAYEVARAIKHLHTESDFYDDEENMLREEKGFWSGLADKAFTEVAGRFPDTVLGDYCAFVSSPPPEYQGLDVSSTHLIFNSTLG
jgi:hypothetical protein